MISLALYQPDIPQNVGAAMRLAACTGVKLDLIGPFGFPWDESKMRRSGMDYMTLVNYSLHDSWDSFAAGKGNRRIILMTTKAAAPYCDFMFKEGDILLAGRESAGVPEDVHLAADARIVIPMQGGARSMNIVNASAMILGEALRQTRWSKT